MFVDSYDVNSFNESGTGAFMNRNMYKTLNFIVIVVSLFRGNI